MVQYGTRLARLHITDLLSRYRRPQMRRINLLPLAALAAAAIVIFPSLHASANIIIASGVTAVGQGFGSIPRLLTVQGAQSPPAEAESACDANSGGTLVVGCLATDAAIGGNGFI